MVCEESHFKSPADGAEIYTISWLPQEVKLLVFIVHGMGEHAMRYDHFARFLCENNIAVFSCDHRGHGQTATIENRGIFANSNGWQMVLDDIYAIASNIKAKFDDKKFILLGHSMGSFLARSLASFPEKSQLFDAYIYSGTVGNPGLLGHIGHGLAKIICKIKGPTSQSKLMALLMFNDLNKKIKPVRTQKDWICSDPNVVDKYLNDQLIVLHFKSAFFVDLVGGIVYINKKKTIALHPKDKPILLFAGDKDPIGDYGKGVIDFCNRLKQNNASQIDVKIYPNRRHEMLNETNKEEVYTMIMDWINEHT